MSAYDDLARYLNRRLPPDATELQLCRGDELLARYSCAHIAERPLADVARELVDAADSDADGAGFQCRYVVRWCDGDGRVVQAPHSWRAGIGAVQPLDGGAISLVTQTQRHLEAMMRQHVGAISTVLQQATGISTMATERLLATERRLAIIEADNTALRAQLREAEGQEATPEPSAIETAAIRLATAYAQAHGVPIPTDPMGPAGDTL